MHCRSYKLLQILESHSEEPASKSLRSKPTHMNKQIVDALQELKEPYDDIIAIVVCLRFIFCGNDRQLMLQEKEFTFISPKVFDKEISISISELNEIWHRT